MDWNTTPFWSANFKKSTRPRWPFYSRHVGTLLPRSRLRNHTVNHNQFKQNSGLGNFPDKHLSMNPYTLWGTQHSVRQNSEISKLACHAIHRKLLDSVMQWDTTPQTATQTTEILPQHPASEVTAAVMRLKQYLVLCCCEQTWVFVEELNYNWLGQFLLTVLKPNMLLWTTHINLSP